MLRDKLNGWQIVTALAIAAGLIGWLVHEGETLGVIIAGILAILGALGFSIAQGQENKNLANGNLTALREQLAEKDKAHSEEIQRILSQASLERNSLQAQLTLAHDKAASYAAQVQPEGKVE